MQPGPCPVHVAVSIPHSGGTEGGPSHLVSVLQQQQQLFQTRETNRQSARKGENSVVASRRRKKNLNITPPTNYRTIAPRNADRFAHGRVIERGSKWLQRKTMKRDR